MTSIFQALKAKDQVADVVAALGFKDPKEGSWAATLEIVGKRARASLKSQRTSNPSTLRRLHAVAAVERLQWQRPHRAAAQPKAVRA